MKIQKTQILTIDLEKHRQRLNKSRSYTKDERARLNRLYDLFERGEFQECLAFASTWPDTKNEYPEIEHIPTDIMDVLQDISWGITKLKDIKVMPNPCLICKEERCIC